LAQARLVEVVRGELTESQHLGSIAVVDNSGTLVLSYGEADLKTYWRSAAKPIQALPLVDSGAAAAFDLSPAELAVITASHSGEERHLELVRSILAKINLGEEHLKCGSHLPYSREAKRKLRQAGRKPGPLYNNCSGKHAGMLALCQHQGWDVENYLKEAHPLQKYLLDYISLFTDYPQEKIVRGTDGCGVVVYGLPLKNMALAFARLSSPLTVSEDLARAAHKIKAAMLAHPLAIGGEGRFNSVLLQATNKKLIAKSGAEGVFCFGYQDKGVAIKIIDGHRRALPPVVMKILSELEVLNEEEENSLAKYFKPVVTNHRGEEVGFLEPVF